jgi:hypothetical protein
LADITTTAAAPSLSGHGVARGDRAVGLEHRLEPGERFDGGAGARAIVLGDDRAVGFLVGRDLAFEEAAGDGLLGAVLREARELVLALAADLLVFGDVLRGLAHRDVDVGQPLRCLPTTTFAGGAGGAALFGLGEAFVVRPAIAAPLPKRLTASTPPAMNTSPSPERMACEAMRIVCSDDEQ